MNIGVVVQARYGSTRLRGKVLKPLAGRSMLFRVVERAQAANRPDQFVVAVPYAESDDPVAQEARSVAADVVRGSEDDVLARYVQATLRYELDVVVRLTADNPFVTGTLIDAMVDRFQETEMDYLHNVRESGYPLGTCVEVVRSSALQEAFAHSDRQSDHEHVTSYLYSKDTGYRTEVFRRDEPIDDVRLTVDTEEDYQLASWIFKNIEGSPARFDLNDVLRLREENPDQFRINQSVQQKSIHE